jgi:hypothetical protein
MRLLVTQERLERTVTVGELLDMQSDSLPTVVGMMAKFVIDSNGAYLNPADGLAELRKMTILDLREAAGDFTKKIVEAAVPPQNASDLNAPSTQEQQPPQAG